MTEWAGSLAEELARRYVAGWAMNAFAAEHTERVRNHLLNGPRMPPLDVNAMMNMVDDKTRRVMERSLGAMTDEDRREFEAMFRPVERTLAQIDHDLPAPMRGPDGELQTVLDPIDGLGGAKEWIARLDHECLERVVRWEYWTGEAYSIVPLERQLTHSPRGKQLQEGNGDETWHFGFDDKDRLVVRRIGYRAGRNQLFWRRNAYHVWRADGVDRFEFDSDPRHYDGRDLDVAPKLLRVELDDERVIGLEEFRGNEYTNDRDMIAARAEYDYDESGRIARIRCVSLNAKALAEFLGILNYQSPDTAAVAEVAWTSRGTLDCVELVEGRRGDGRTTLFRRRRGDEPGINELLRQIEDALVEGIPIALAHDLERRRASSPIWCIELMYDFDNASAWPTTWVGTTSDRDASEPTDWNFAEWAMELNADPAVPSDLEPVILRVEELLNESDSWWRFRKMLCAASRRLVEFAWPESIARSDDFVVTAIDIELVDLERNLKEVLGSARVRELKRSGRL